MRIKHISTSLLVATLALSACGGAPASNELQIDNDGYGRFSGSAGSAWTADEIRRHAQNSICGYNQYVANFSVRSLPSAPGYLIFSGQCI